MAIADEKPLPISCRCTRDALSILLWVCWLVSWSAASCAPPDSRVEPVAVTVEHGSDSAGVMSNDGSYRVRYTTRPAPIPLNRLFEMEVEVCDADGKPARGITLNTDAIMPAHHHGMNTQPEVTATGTGRFLVRGMQLHMAGHWELHFDITRGAVTERAQFDLDLE